MDNIDALLEVYARSATDLSDSERMRLLGGLREHADNVLASSVEPTISRPSLPLVIAACHRHLLKTGRGIEAVEEFDRWARSAASVLGDGAWRALYFLLRSAQSDVVAASTSGPSLHLPPTGPPLSALNVNTHVQSDLESLKRDAMDERELMRDLLFVLQGSDSQYLQWSDEAGAFQFRLGVRVSAHQRMIVGRIVGAGTVYRRLSIELAHYRRSDGLGETQRAFLDAMHAELFDYYLKGIVNLEALIMSTATDSGTNLFGMIQLTREGSRRLHFLETLFRECMGEAERSKSGPLLNYLYRLSKSPMRHVQTPARRLFQRTFRPMWLSVQAWLLRGEVTGEFFVRLTGKTDWKRGFELVRERLPDTIVDKQLLGKVLTIGKTQRLLHFDCANPVLQASDAPDDLVLLAMAVRDLYAAINAFAHDRLLNHHGLIGHLHAIRQFVLLEQGDFCSLLLELLRESLGKPAPHLYRMNLLSCLDTAVALSSSFLKSHPSIMGNLDVKIIEVNGKQQLGWDAFALDYRVPEALQASVLSPEAMQEYARMSHFSWNLRRVHFVLASLHAKMAHLHKHAHPELRGLERLLVLLISEMNAFINGVMTGAGVALMHAWTRFERTVGAQAPQATSVETLIGAHDAYLEDLKRFFVLWSNSALKNKLGSLCSVILKTESLVASLTSANVNETIATVHASARHFQAEMDDLLHIVRRGDLGADPTGDMISFVDFADWNDYHGRRAGFDERKYRLVAPSRP